MVERQPSKLDTWVRFPSPAPVSAPRVGATSGFKSRRHARVRPPVSRWAGIGRDVVGDLWEALRLDLSVALDRDRLVLKGGFGK
jgi:hypothetical protein